MYFSIFLAIRYLHASRENRYFSWITILSILGLTIGVAALIVVLSVFDGFENEVRTRMLQSNAHIVASLYPAGMEAPEKWIQVMMRNPEFGSEIKAISPFVQGETMAKNAAALQGVALRGIDPKRQEKVQSFVKLVHPATALRILQNEMDAFKAGKPEPELPAIIVGSRLMETLNAKVGAIVWMLDPSSAGFASSKAFKVIGVFNSGLKIYDSRLIVMSLTTAQRFTGMGGKVTGLSIALKHPRASVTLGKLMGKTYDQLTIKDWQSLNSNFFQVMENERTRVGLIVMLVALVAGFNILTAVFTSVTQRQKDISILKAVGATNRQIMHIFLIQSTMIGFIGSLIGVILAAVIAYGLRNYPFLDLPEPYFLNTLPASFNGLIYGSVCLIATCICWFAGLYPAFIASRVSPTEGMASAIR